MSRAQALSALRERDPGNPDLLCALLDELLSQGLVALAEQTLTGLPAALRQSAGVCFRESRCALLAGDFRKVVALLAPLTSSLRPVPAGISHDLAFAQLLLGEADTALASINLSPAAGDEAVALGLLKARILHHQQHFEAALQVLASLGTHDRLAEAEGLRSLLLLDSGRMGDASASAQAALAADPSQFEAGLVTGTLALWARHPDHAEACFQVLVDRQPSAGRAHLGLGEAMMLKGKLDEAMPTLARAAHLMPSHLGTLHALAWCQLLRGDLHAAKASFDHAFSLDRTFAETHGGRALIHALLGERSEAEEAIKRAVRLDPNGLTARYAQSVLLLDEGRTQDAQRIVDGLISATQGGSPRLEADFIHALRARLGTR